ncbi:uncharacterized protein LOC143029602 [Oratosquilla oratoria]|uniref:uncharacterized protein LOC143029602 n=1 Tax=Oratosquilla oratoria TaxID=337810 RepID=UPI003F76A311
MEEPSVTEPVPPVITKVNGTTATPPATAATNEETQVTSGRDSAKRSSQRRRSSLKLRVHEQKSVDKSNSISFVFDPKNENIVANDVQEPEAEERLEEQPVNELDMLLAAIYVEDAREGRHSDFKLSERHLYLYRMYHSAWMTWILYFVLAAHLGLALFEHPAVPELALSYWASMIIEGGFLLFYLFRLSHISSFTPLTQFWCDTKNVLLTALIGLTFLDMIIYTGLVENGIYAVRWSRPLRPFFVVNFPEMRQIRRSFRNLRRTLPDVTNVLFLFFLSLAIFALMAFKLFGGRNWTWVDGRPYFGTYLDSVFDLYVLVTTANNPDIMMPAFDQSVYYVIFFVLFLIICYFIYMNIILAVIYNDYRSHLKNEVKKSVYSKRQQLAKAFDLIATDVNGKNLVTHNRFVQLLQSLPDKRNPALVNVLWIVLDSDISDGLDKAEFLKLADLLNVEVSVVVDRTILIARTFPGIYNSRISKFIQRMVRHKLFQYFFDVLILINAIVIGLDDDSKEWGDIAEWIFLSFFMLEIMLKLYVYGFTKFFRKTWNVFDFLVIGSAFVMGLIEEINYEAQESRVTLDVLMVLRVLRLVKIVGSIKRFRVIVLTINKIIPSLVTYGGVLLVFCYIFAIIGMEVFHGLVVFYGYDEGSKPFCGNEALVSTDFWHDHYCNNNFNDIIHAFILLFELTVVNQWQVIAYGYSAVTTHWARLFFLSFHLVCVIIVLNIFTAFVLEVFMLEYSACQGHLETQLEKKIQERGLSMKQSKKKRKATISQEDLVDTDSDSSTDEDEADGAGASDNKAPNPRDLSDQTDVRFHISKKNRTVEVLLHKMFEKEIDVDDLGQNTISLDPEPPAPKQDKDWPAESEA